MNQVVNTILQIKTKITKIQKARKRILKMAQILGRQKTVVVKNINTCFLFGTVRIPALLLNLKLSPRAMLLTSIFNKLKIVVWMFSFLVVWSKTKNFNEEIFIFSKMWSIIKKCLRKAASRSMSRILKKWFKLMKVYIF